MKRINKVLLIIAVVLILDQSLKIWVKTHMAFGDEIPILGLPWALIHFVESSGMAGGITFGGTYGKLALSLFRILFAGLLILVLRILLKRSANFGAIFCFSLFLAGGLSNIIDAAFYGMIFSESTPYGDTAVLFPPEGGYSSFLHGKNVSMLYFPIVSGYYPDWVPAMGGERFLFFKPVISLADFFVSFGFLGTLSLYGTRYLNPIKEDKVISEILPILRKKYDRGQ